MALLAPQKVVNTGTNVTLAAATAGGDTLALNPGSILWVKTAGTAITVTIVIPGNDQYGTAKPDLAISCSATADKFIGPLDTNMIDPADSLIHITYTAVTNTTVAHISQ